jgi:gluconolactonase
MGSATGRCWLDDGNPEATATLNKHYVARTVAPHSMAQAQGTLAPWMASLTFWGPDLKTLYLGSLMGTTIPDLHLPVAGLPPIHWRGRRLAARTFSLRTHDTGRVDEGVN